MSRFVELSPSEETFIATLERDNREVGKGRVLSSVGDKTNSIMVLKSGWAVVQTESPDGRSQILRIYLPGEVMGMAELGASQAHHRIVMQTDGVVCPFPRMGLPTLISDYPRLAALLISIGSLDQIALRFHASALGTMDAAQRLKFFLLQLRARLEVADVGMGNRIYVPFSQAELGQAVGLSSIYINKLLQKFRADGEIEIARPYYRLLARDAWERETDFVNPFDEMDTSWFPPPPPDEPA